MNHLLSRVKCQNKSERTVRKNDESYLKLPSMRNFSCLHACTLLGKQQGTKTRKTLQILSAIFPNRFLDFLKGQSVFGF